MIAASRRGREWNPTTYFFHRKEMASLRKDTSDMGDVGTPASDPIVKNNREEMTDPENRADLDDECDLNPVGRQHSDGVHLKTRKGNLRIGTWNVRTLYKAGKLDNLIKEAKQMKMDIMGIAETRWIEEGYIKKDDYILIYSGGTQHVHGVGILLKSDLEKNIQGYWSVSDRVILLKIRAKPFDMVLIQVYAPTAEASEEEIETFYEDLEKAIKEVHSTNILVILGDFNAKVGKSDHQDIMGKFGMGKRNERGERLMNFCEKHNVCITNTFFQHPIRRLYTWKSPGDVKRNQIDYILIRKRFRNSIKQCKTYPGADIGSDHNPVVATMKIRLKKAQSKSEKKTLYDIDSLKNKETQEKYLVEVRNKYDTLMYEGLEQYKRETPTKQIDMEWNCIRESIKEANVKLPPKERKAKQPWMTTDILNLMDERKKKKNTEIYQALDRQVDKRCKEAKREWLETKCQNIERYSKSQHTRAMFEEINSIIKPSRSRTAGRCIKNKEGKILFEKEDIKRRWTEYIEELFQDDRDQLPTPSNNRGPQITKHETENALYKIKDGKAPGLDEIPIEMLKALEDFGIEKLTDLFNKIYETGHLPDDLLQSVFITIPKKSKANDCSDFRTISLMSHTTKVLLRIILERIKGKINKEIGENQFGFRSGCGTREGIFALNMITQKYQEVQKDIYACFIDYAKAFDKVRHSQMIEGLERIGIDGKDIRIIANMYWKQKAAIRVVDEISDFTNINRGVRQGCVLSPYLFNIYTELIFRETDDMKGINIQGKNINNLRYADDTVLLTEKEEDLINILQRVKEQSAERGLHMNARKTKTMFISRKETQRLSIQLDGEELEQVKAYKYLGQMVNEKGSCEQEIRTRIFKARTAFQKMNNILTSKKLPAPLRLRLTKCFVLSVLLYGCETWTINKTAEKKLEAFEMWTFRRIGKIKWTEKMTNTEVCNKLKVKRELINTIRKRKMIYFGHLVRHNNILKTITEGRVEGKRPRGRPPRKWIDDIKEWRGRSAVSCTREADDRLQWRAISRQPLDRGRH